MQDPNIIRSFKCSEQPLLSLSFSDYHLATGGEEGHILVWNLNKICNPLKLIGHKNNITNLDFHKNNKNLVSSSSDCSIKIWDIETDGLYNTLTNHTLDVNSVQFHPTNNLILSGSDDGNLILNYYNDNQETPNFIILDNTDYPINASKFSNDGKICVYGNSIADVNIMDLETQTMLFNYNKITNKNISYFENTKTEQSHISNTSINFHPDGNCIFLGYNNGSVELFDIRIKTKIWEIKPINNKVKNVSCCYDGSSILISGISPFIKLIDLKKGNILNNFMAHPDGGCIAEFSNKGEYFASGGQEGNCLIWNNIYNNNKQENFIEQKEFRHNLKKQNNLQNNNKIEYKIGDKLNTKINKIKDIMLSLTSKIEFINQRIDNNNVQLENIEEFIKNKEFI